MEGGQVLKDLRRKRNNIGVDYDLPTKDPEEINYDNQITREFRSLESGMRDMPIKEDADANRLKVAGMFQMGIFLPCILIMTVFTNPAL